MQCAYSQERDPYLRELDQYPGQVDWHISSLVRRLEQLQVASSRNAYLRIEMLMTRFFPANAHVSFLDQQAPGSTALN